MVRPAGTESQDRDLSAMKPPRITEETLKTLGVIAHLGEATPKQVREKTGLASGTVSPILARLEEAGWLAHREEAAEARALGRPLRVFYRIADEAAVRAMGERLLGALRNLVEDLG